MYLLDGGSIEIYFNDENGKSHDIEYVQEMYPIDSWWDKLFKRKKNRKTNGDILLNNKIITSDTQKMNDLLKALETFKANDKRVPAKKELPKNTIAVF